MTKRMSERKGGLRGTLLLTYICVGILPLLLFTGLVLSSLTNYYTQERKKEMLRHGNVLAGYISLSGFFSERDDYDALTLELARAVDDSDEGYRTLVISTSGRVVSDSFRVDQGKTLLLPEVVAALENRDVANVRADGVMYAAVSIANEDNDLVGCVLLCTSMEDIQANLDSVGRTVRVILAGILSVVAFIMLLVSRQITEPLRQMIVVIKSMADGRLDQRVQVKQRSHNEVMELAEACNTMAEKLEQVENSRQQFVSNVSHELKTPLSSLKVLSESLLLEQDVPKETYVEFLQDINSEVDRMTAIINDLLALVRLGQDEPEKVLADTDMDELMSSVVKRLQPLARKKNINLRYDLVKNSTAQVDAMRLSLALSNLVDNAIKYTPENGSISVSLDADHQNAFVTVSDNGVGIAEEELDKIFERFYRVDKTRGRDTGGTGLGLAITKATVLFHNGSIKVTSNEGEGTTFVVRLPLRYEQN